MNLSLVNPAPDLVNLRLKFSISATQFSKSAPEYIKSVPRIYQIHASNLYKFSKTFTPLSALCAPAPMTYRMRVFALTFVPAARALLLAYSLSHGSRHHCQRCGGRSVVVAIFLLHSTGTAPVRTAWRRCYISIRGKRTSNDQQVTHLASGDTKREVGGARTLRNTCSRASDKRHTE